MTVDYSKALKLAISSQEIYTNFAEEIKFTHWSEKPTLISKETTDTQLAILTDPSETTIIFRGSDSSIDWGTNLDTRQERKEFDQQIIKGEIVSQREKIYPYLTGNESGSLMHRGFVKAYFSVRDDIHEYIKQNNVSNITITGHSLGGALAILCAVDVQYNFNDQLASIETYTFGAPKVGNKEFCQSYNQRIPKSYHFIHGMDIVPELPRWWQGYDMTKQELRIGSRFSWNFISARFKDHAISNYINVFQGKLSGSVS